MSPPTLQPLPPIPPRGIVRLAAGAVYLAPAGGVKAWSCTFVKNGPSSAPNPKIHYAGPQTPGVRETAALLVPAGCSAQFFDIDFDCPGWSYAICNEGTLEADGVRVSGGGGLLRVNGASGLTLFARYAQLAASVGWCFYSGPKPLIQPGVYDESWSRPISLLDGEALLGSTEFGLGRFHAFDRLFIRNPKWSDVKSQSAKHPDGTAAVTNAVFRAHYGGDVILSGGYMAGDQDWGPGEYDNALPPGPERDYRSRERLNSIVASDVAFTLSSFKLAPGVLDALLQRCSVSGVSGVACPPASMQRPQSMMRLDSTPFSKGGPQ